MLEPDGSRQAIVAEAIDQREKLLEFIWRNRRVTGNELQQVLSVSGGTVIRIFKEL